MDDIVQETFSCPICFEILRNPVTTLCGHNYCKECLVGESCAICRSQINPNHYSINYQLRNFLEHLNRKKQQENHQKYKMQIEEAISDIDNPFLQINNFRRKRKSCELDIYANKYITSEYANHTSHLNLNKTIVEELNNPFFYIQPTNRNGIGTDFNNVIDLLNRFEKQLNMFS